MSCCNCSKCGGNSEWFFYGNNLYHEKLINEAINSLTITRAQIVINTIKLQPFF